MSSKSPSGSTVKGLKLCDESKCQISIIEGQGMATKQEVVESAVHLLYSIMPNDRNDRKPLSLVVEKAIEALTVKQYADEDHLEGDNHGV